MKTNSDYLCVCVCSYWVASLNRNYLHFFSKKDIFCHVSLYLRLPREFFIDVRCLPLHVDNRRYFEKYGGHYCCHCFCFVKFCFSFSSSLDDKYHMSVVIFFSSSTYTRRLCSVCLHLIGCICVSLCSVCVSLCVREHTRACTLCICACIFVYDTCHGLKSHEFLFFLIDFV